MLTYVSAFTSGGLEPFWPHFSLLFISVIASFSVGAGIIFESPKYSASVHQVATCLVIWGVVIEAVCTIFLFVFDEGISGSQQSKIIALETQIAARPFDKSQFDAFKLLKGKIKAVNIISEAALEPNMFAGMIAVAIQNAGVDVKGYPASDGMMMTGLMILYPDSLESVDKLEDDPLYKAFTDAGLNPSAGSLKNWFPFAKIPRDIPLIFVGEKPIPVIKFPYVSAPSNK
jgi:hypothetical protein